VCLCVCERERERVRVGVCEYVRERKARGGRFSARRFAICSNSSFIRSYLPSSVLPISPVGDVYPGDMTSRRSSSRIPDLRSRCTTDVDSTNRPLEELLTPAMTNLENCCSNMTEKKAGVTASSCRLTWFALNNSSMACIATSSSCVCERVCVCVRACVCVRVSVCLIV